MSVIRTVSQLQADIEQEQKLMLIHEKNGNYVDAQKSRIKIEQLHQDLLSRNIYEMELRHKKEYNELSHANKDQLARFNAEMDGKMNSINQEGDRLEKEMKNRHKQDLDSTRKQLEKELSPKVKESSELLNLRKMEEQMVKQKNYAQAHTVQQSIFQRQKQEKASWLEKREQKIQTALDTLKDQHNVELASLKKRIKTSLDELFTDRKIQEDRLLKKHQHLHKDLKSLHDKQILNYKGEFRSKGGRDSPLRLKSSFVS